MIIAVGPIVIAVRNLECRERRNSVHFELESITEEELESRAKRIAAVASFEVWFSVDIDGCNGEKKFPTPQ